MTDLEKVTARFVEVGGYLIHPDQIAETLPSGDVVLTDGRRFTREGITA